jgi:hypothetical protein
MPTQRRNRQRKNRRNSQRRNRKNLQRGGVSILGFNFFETPEEKDKREAKEKDDVERNKRDAELLANASQKSRKLLGEKIQSDATAVASESANAADVDSNPGENNKEDEVRKPLFPGGKQKKSIKKNKKSNKKR